MADERSSVVKRLIAAFVPRVPGGEARMLREHTANVQILTSLNQIRHTTFSWYVLGQAALLAALGTVRGTELLELSVAGAGIGFSVVTFALVSRVVAYARFAEYDLRSIERLILGRDGPQGTFMRQREFFKAREPQEFFAPRTLTFPGTDEILDLPKNARISSGSLMVYTPLFVAAGWLVFAILTATNVIDLSMTDAVMPAADSSSDVQS